MLLNSFRFGPSSYESQVLADTPVLYWRLAEASGTTIVDASGNGRDGTYSGSGYTLGGSSLLPSSANNSLTVDGTARSGYRTDVSGDTRMNLNFSWECVFRNDNVAAGGGLLSNGYGGALMRATGSSIALVRSEVAEVSALIGSVPISQGVVYHCVITVSASGDWIIYRNGSSILSGTTAETFSLGTAPFSVGCDVNGSNVPFSFLQGAIDEVAIYSGVLSPARVTAHFAASGL